MGGWHFWDWGSLGHFGVRFWNICERKLMNLMREMRGEEV